MSDQVARDIEILAELFKAGQWNELRLESDTISLLLSRDGQARPLGAAAQVLAHALSGAGDRGGGRADDQMATAGPSASSASAVDPAWVPVLAPNLGTFYRAPKPGAAPFVEVGQFVEPATEVCLIEVMKLFTSVKAGVAGTVRHIAVPDGELVNGGQALLYIERA